MYTMDIVGATEGHTWGIDRRRLRDLGARIRHRGVCYNESIVNKSTMPKWNIRRTVPIRLFTSLLSLSLLSMVLFLACGSQGEGREGDDTKDEAALIWDAWGKIDESYAGQEDLDLEAVVSAALGHMLDLVDAPSYPFLTEVGRLRGQVLPGVPEEMTDVWRGLVLHQQRWPDIENSELVAAAISGMIAGLGDPQAEFLNAESYSVKREAIDESLEGTYLGIGARVVAQDDQIILFPFRDSPAEKAEIQAGDSLLAVAGVTTAGKTLQEVVEHVVGPLGTKVTLLVQRTDEPDPLELEVFRDEISLQSVTRQLVPGGIGYIFISQFRDNTGEQLYESLEALKQIDMLALILDLRSNPGGSEEAASDVVGQFLPPGSLFIYQEDRNGERREHYVREDLDRFDLGEMPIVVLVNEQTIGEAEAVAAVLQETGRAVLLGTETFGKGATYIFEELADGSAIYIPTLRWYTPSGKRLGRDRVQPDIPVVSQRESTGYGGESQFNRAYDHLDAQLPPFR